MASREKLLRFNPFRSELVKVSLPDGEELSVKVLQPSVGHRNRIVAERLNEKVSPGMALARSQALAVVLCCVEPDGSPDAGKPVFTEADIDALCDVPAGSNGWVDLLAARAMALMSDGADAAKK